MTKTYKMAAVSGDMSSTGMGTTNKVITLSSKQYKIAQEWIEFQNTFQEQFPILFKEQIQSGKLNDELTNLSIKDQELTNKMFDLDIFCHKYDARTSWKIVA
jgi:hypothetical protein